MSDRTSISAHMPSEGSFTWERRVLALGHVLLASMIFFGAIGVFGEGRVSTRIDATGGVEVVSQRFVRNGTQVPLIVRAPAGADVRALELSGGEPASRGWRIDRVTPGFRTSASGSSERLDIPPPFPSEIVVTLAYDCGLRWVPVRLLINGESLRLSQFCYP